VNTVFYQGKDCILKLPTIRRPVFSRKNISGSQAGQIPASSPTNITLSQFLARPAEALAAHQKPFDKPSGGPHEQKKVVAITKPQLSQDGLTQRMHGLWMV